MFLGHFSGIYIDIELSNDSYCFATRVFDWCIFFFLLFSKTILLYIIVT